MLNSMIIELHHIVYYTELFETFCTCVHLAIVSIFNATKISYEFAFKIAKFIFARIKPKINYGTKTIKCIAM